MSTPPTQGQAESPVKRVIDHIVAERFTGVLRIRSREADGEVWFLAGIQEDARFGMSKGDEAYNRLLRATDPVFEAEQRLPSLTGGFKKSLPAKGSFAEVLPVDLMRYCETFALTCVLELVGKSTTVRITYRTGELLSADAGSGGDDALASLLESQEGSYEFEVPPFELPAGTRRPRLSTRPPGPAGLPSSPPPPAAKPSLAERVDRSISGDNAEAKRQAELASETKRRSEAEAEARRKAEAEAEAQRQAEARRKGEAEAEAQRQVDARRKAEAEAAQRYADGQRQAQAQREEEERRHAEALRIEEEREAEEQRQAETQRQGETQRQAEAQRQAEEQRQIEEVERKAEAKRKAELRDKPKAAAKPVARAEKSLPRNRSVSAAPAAPRNVSSLWMWLILALVAAAVVHFFFQEPP